MMFVKQAIFLCQRAAAICLKQNKIRKENKEKKPKKTKKMFASQVQEKKAPTHELPAARCKKVPRAHRESLKMHQFINHHLRAGLGQIST